MKHVDFNFCSAQAVFCMDSPSAAMELPGCERNSRCFRVSLQRENATKSWGIQVALQPGSSEGLVISSVHPTADAVKQWNLEHPQQLVEPGTAICEINGQAGALQMVLQMRCATSLEILISRDLTISQQAALHAAVGYGVEDVTREVQELPSEMCAICLDEMGSGCSGRCVELNRCAHRFHKKCIQKWLLSGGLRCPLCNQNLK